MKITKQIGERKFEVELEDLDFSREKRIIVAHDYVRFMGNSGMQTISSSNVPLHTVNTCAKLDSYDAGSYYSYKRDG